MSFSLGWLSRGIMFIWFCNCIIGAGIAVHEVWIPYMNAGNDSYTKIQSDPFDGTVMPIAYIPDWTKSENQDKSKRFEDINISEYIPIPQYDPIALLDTKNSTKASTILHYTYFTPYMGSYRLNYKEFDGSHNAIDIRVPIGTPVLSIANGIVVKTIEADGSGDRFIVIRHDGVNLEGKVQSLYSCYLHLSEILIQEGTKVRKGDMIGRTGMSGIATTPHLHIQIDTADAPFHPYWPFTSSDSRAAGLGFYDSINAGLGKENALKYSINPMSFINMYLGGTTVPTFSTAPVTQGTEVVTDQGTKTIASYVSENDPCTKKRYNDVGETSTLGKMLYPLVDKKCLFQKTDQSFSSKGYISQREAITNLMKFYGIVPSNGTSHFLDIPIGDVFQGYALVAYRRGLLDGNYAYPEKILSKGEFIELLVKIAQPEKNPSQIRIYNDVDPMNPHYKSAQDYGYMVRARGGKLYTENILTRANMVQMLAAIQQKK